MGRKYPLKYKNRIDEKVKAGLTTEQNSFIMVVRASTFREKDGIQCDTEGDGICNTGT